MISVQTQHLIRELFQSVGEQELAIERSRQDLAVR